MGNTRYEGTRTILLPTARFVFRLRGIHRVVGGFIIVIVTRPAGITLGAEGVLPGGYIESLLRVFKQFTHT